MKTGKAEEIHRERQPMHFIFYRECFLILRLCFPQAIILLMKNDGIKKVIFLTGSSDILNISSAFSLSPLMCRDSSVTEVELICDVGGKVEIIL